MFLTPMLFILFDKVVLGFYQKGADSGEQDDIDEQGTVIVAGIGRFGQIVNRLLLANDVPTVVLDHSATVVDNLSKVNIKSWYGDASRSDLLHGAGIAEASLLVVAIDERTKALEMVHHVKKFYPHVKVIARAFDRGHSYELSQAGADMVMSETYFSALEMGGEALKALDFHPFKVEQMKAAFRKIDEEHREQFYSEWLKAEEKNKYTRGYLDLFIKMEKKITTAIKRNRLEGHDPSEEGWTPPPKNYVDDFE